MPGALLPGTTATFSVTASTAGKLDAWIDFDGDGIFEPSERIATGLSLIEGINTISVSVPPTARLGTTYARFRVSTSGGLEPSGLAVDGEVEDYRVEIVGQNTAMLVPDPQNPGSQMLVVVGTNSRDRLRIDPAGSNLTVKSGSKVLGTFPTATVGRILVYGLNGNDTIQINSVLSIPTELRGGLGDDRLYGGAAADQLFGEGGNDRLYGGAGNDQLFAGAGNDRLFGDDGNDKLYGHAGDDSLKGGNGNDELSGGLGNDKLYGENGNDLLMGGDGNDMARGGDGNDKLYGNNGDDKLYGDAGSDLILGGNGNDSLYGGKGRNLLIGGLGADLLRGDRDDDILIGGTTSYDNNEPALLGILNEWTTATPFLTRINNLRTLLNSSTVYSDGVLDLVYGSLGQDWMLDFELLDEFRDFNSSSTSGDAKN